MTTRAPYLADRCHDGCYRHLLDLTHGLQQTLSHGLVLNLNNARSGLRALARVLELWVNHFLRVTVTIRPEARVDDPAWRWHLGLDVQSSALARCPVPGPARARGIDAPPHQPVPPGGGGSDGGAGRHAGAAGLPRVGDGWGRSPAAARSRPGCGRPCGSRPCSPWPDRCRCPESGPAGAGAGTCRRCGRGASCRSPCRCRPRSAVHLAVLPRAWIRMRGGRSAGVNFRALSIRLRRTMVRPRGSAATCRPSGISTT
jgi:hypothetical protein